MIPIICAALACVIIDGDTLRIGDERVRLWGVDAPEIDAPGGSAATVALEILATGGLRCIAPPSGQDRDRYGRAVRLCLDWRGRDVAALLVADGWAEDAPRYSGGWYSQD